MDRLKARILHFLPEEKKFLHQIYSKFIDDHANLWREAENLDLARLRYILFVIVKLFYEEHKHLNDISQVDQNEFNRAVRELISNRDAFLQKAQRAQIKAIDRLGVERWFNAFKKDIEKINSIINKYEVSGVPSRGQDFIPSIGLYSRLPDDLREKMIQAVDQMLGIGDMDTKRGQSITDWSLKAIHEYRLLRVPESEIKKKVERRLESFLETGRRSGLSLNPRVAGFLSGEQTRETIVMSNDFQTKYNLASFRKLKSLLGEFDKSDIGNSYYSISLQTAFAMAAEIGDKNRALEICLHMIKLGNFEAAYKTAEKLGDDRTLLGLGKLALVDFFDQYSPYGMHNALNRLDDAIECLKRVQGAEKPIAEEMLYDLGTEISSDRFIADYIRTVPTIPEGTPQGMFDTGMTKSEIRDTLLNYSLKALRSTGKLVKRVPLDSVKVDFETEVKNRKYMNAIITLVQRVMTTAARPNLDEVRKSLEAIGDVNMLNSHAEEIFEQRHDPQGYTPSGIYSFAIDFFRAAGNKEGIKRVIDAELSEGLVRLDADDYWIHIVPVMAEIGYTEGLKRIQATTSTTLTRHSKKHHGFYSWQKVQKKVESALAGEPLEKVDEVALSIPRKEGTPDYIHEALVEEKRLILSLEESRTKLTPEVRQELIREGYELLQNGDEWNACICFEEALYRKGLIEAGDAMLRKGNGLNALTPYKFAALIKDET